jgi:hypothetical protein
MQILGAYLYMFSSTRGRRVDYRELYGLIRKVRELKGFR